MYILGICCEMTISEMAKDLIDKNIERRRAHIIVSWPNPKQWVIVHTSDLMTMIRQSIFSLNHHKGDGKIENTQPQLCIVDNW